MHPLVHRLLELLRAGEIEHDQAEAIVMRAFNPGPILDEALGLIDHAAVQVKRVAADFAPTPAPSDQGLRNVPGEAERPSAMGQFLSGLGFAGQALEIEEAFEEEEEDARLPVSPVQDAIGPIPTGSSSILERAFGMLPGRAREDLAPPLALVEAARPFIEQPLDFVDAPLGAASAFFALPDDAARAGRIAAKIDDVASLRPAIRVEGKTFAARRGATHFDAAQRAKQAGAIDDLFDPRNPRVDMGFIQEGRQKFWSRQEALEEFGIDSSEKLNEVVDGLARQVISDRRAGATEEEIIDGLREMGLSRDNSLTVLDDVDNRAAAARGEPTPAPRPRGKAAASAEEGEAVVLIKSGEETSAIPTGTQFGRGLQKAPTVFVHKNTIPGEGPWRVTGLRGGEPVAHLAFNSRDEAMAAARSWGFTEPRGKGAMRITPGEGSSIRIQSTTDPEASFILDSELQARLGDKLDDFVEMMASSDPFEDEILDWLTQNARMSESEAINFVDATAPRPRGGAPKASAPAPEPVNPDDLIPAIRVDGKVYQPVAGTPRNHMGARSNAFQKGAIDNPLQFGGVEDGFVIPGKGFVTRAQASDLTNGAVRSSEDISTQAVARIRGGPEAAPDIPDQVPGVEVTDADRLVARLHAEKGGSTVNPRTGENVMDPEVLPDGFRSLDDDRWAVVPYDDPVASVTKVTPFTPEEVATFRAANSDLLGLKNTYIGTWVHPETGNHMLEIARLYSNKDRALRIGAGARQHSVSNLLTGQEVRVPDIEDVAKRALARRDLLDVPGVRARTEAEIVRNLDEPQMEKWNKASQTIRGKIARNYMLMPTVEEAVELARIGGANMDWYWASGQTISSVFGEDAPRFAAMLAATSPNTGVPDNLRGAMKWWEAWVQAGRPKGKEEIAALFPEGEKIIKGASLPNVQKVLAMDADELLKVDLNQEGFLSGPKVDPFYSNLMDVTQRVTIDVHQGKLAVPGGAPTTNERGLAIAAHTRATAERISAQSGGVISPRQAQASLWGTIKGADDMVPRGRSVMETFMPEQSGQGVMFGQIGPEARAALARNIEENPSFAGLMQEDPEVLAGLERLGLREKLPAEIPTRATPRMQPSSSIENPRGITSQAMRELFQRLDLNRQGGVIMPALFAPLAPGLFTGMFDEETL